jgi:hypothetical protein
VGSRRRLSPISSSSCGAATRTSTIGLSEDFRNPALRTLVKILWDRRQAERRRQADPVAVDRPVGRRRQRERDTWTAFGFVAVAVR